MNDFIEPESDEPAAAQQPITPFTIIGELWEGRYIIIAVAALLLVISTVWVLLSFKPTYISSAILEKRQSVESQTAGPRSLLSSLAGSNEFPLYDEFRAELGSITLAERIEARYHILPKLYPAMWNAEKQRWQMPSSIRSYVRKALTPVLDLQPSHPPDAEDLQSYIAKSVIIKAAEPSKLFEVSYSNSDRQLSGDFLNMVITEVDALLKDREEQELSGRVALLNKLLTDTTSQSYRTALVDTTISAAVQRFIVEADSTYSIGIIDAVHTSAWPLSPRWVFIWGVALAVGILIGMLVVFSYNGLWQFRRLQPSPLRRRSRMSWPGQNRAD